MIANGNSFNSPSSCSNGQSMMVNPESSIREGTRLMWGWTGFQTLGNAL